MTETNVWEGLEESFNQTVQVEMDTLKQHVPEDYKTFLEPIKTPKDLVDSFVNAQKLVGKKTELPKLEDEQGMAKIWEHIGAKTKPEDFDFKDIKIDESVLKEVKETFAGVKLTTKQAESVLTKFAALEQAKSQKEEQAFTEFKTKQIEARQNKYGEKLGEAEGVVNFAINKLSKGNEEFEKALKILLDDNNYFDMFKEIGITLKGDNPNGPDDKQVNTKTGGLKEEYENYMNPNTPEGKLYIGGNNQDPDKVAKARARVQEIYKEAAAKNISLR
jgi:hypothetical protein